MFAKRPCLRNASRSAKGGRKERVRRQDLLFLLRRLQKEVRRQSRAVRGKVKSVKRPGIWAPCATDTRLKETSESSTKTNG